MHCKVTHPKTKKPSIAGLLLINNWLSYFIEYFKPTYTMRPRGS